MPSTPSPLSEYAKTLKSWDIPSSRCLFQLALAEHHTEETEYLLLLTPTSVMTCEKPANMRKRAQKNGYQNGTQYGSLESQVMYDPRLKSLLPTPTAIEGEKYTNTFNPNSQMGKSLSAMAGSGMLPTPQQECCPERDGKGFRLSPLFTEEMMGFPLMWTTLPFLSQDGDLKHSRHTETQ